MPTTAQAFVHLHECACMQLLHTYELDMMREKTSVQAHGTCLFRREYCSYMHSAATYVHTRTSIKHTNGTVLILSVRTKSVSSSRYRGAPRCSKDQWPLETMEHESLANIFSSCSRTKTNTGDSNSRVTQIASTQLFGYEEYSLVVKSILIGSSKKISAL